MAVTVNNKNLGHATAYSYAKSKGYTGTEEEFAELMASYATVAESAAASAEAAEAARDKAAEWATGSTSGTPGETNNAEYFSGQAAGSATAASGSADNAERDALKAEGYAVGKQGGAAVSSDSPYYHANGEYYKEQAARSATSAGQSAWNAAADALKAEGYATGKQGGTDVGTDSPYYHANGEYYKDQASGSATAAAGSATNAAADALKSEGYATGKQNGTDVGSDSPYYHNSGKYYLEQTEAVAQSIPADYTELSSDVSSLKSALSLSEIVFVDNKYINTQGSIGSVVDLTPQTSTSGMYSIFDVSEGNSIFLNATGGTAGRLWAFIDSANKLLSHADANAIGENLIVPIPTNATKCIVNIVGHSPDACFYGYFPESNINKNSTKIENLSQKLNDSVYNDFISLNPSFTNGYIAYGTGTLDIIQPSGQSGGSSYQGIIWDKCNAGDLYKAKITATASRWPWFICDTNGAVLSLGTLGAGANDLIIEIPNNGAYFGANLFGLSDYVAKKVLLPKNNKQLSGSIFENIKFNYIHRYIAKGDTININSPTTYSSSFSGGYIFEECSAHDVFYVDIVNTASATYDISFYDASGNVISHSNQGINGKKFVNLCVIAPTNAKYVAFNTSDTNSTVRKLRNEYEYDVEKSNPLKGLKGVAFGTSLTARADINTYTGYLTYLRSMLLCQIDNQGIGGAYWFAPTGNESLNICKSVEDYTGYADKDFAIIEGCVNDWYGGRVLGTYNASVDALSVCGRLHKMIDHIYTQNPNIQIYVILDHYGKVNGEYDCSSTSVRNDKTQFDFYTELEKVCAFWGIPVIREYAISNIGKYGEQYLVDQIHCNELGAKQSATLIAKEMIRFGVKLK